MALGVVTQIGGAWRAVVHRTTCHWYRVARNRNLPIPVGAPIVLCGSCHPTPAEVLADTPSVEFYEHGFRRGERVPVRWVGFEVADDLSARQSLGNGRVPPRKPGFEP